MLYSESEDKYLDMTMQDAYDKLRGINNSNPGFFSHEIFSKLPTLSFDFFSQEEDDNFNKMVKEVLIHSKLYNSYNEVQITYNTEKLLLSPDDYVPVYGDEKSVKFLSDENTKRLVDAADCLAIVTVHNHPDITDFSLKDMIIFSGIPKIKLMSVVNKNGEVSVLYRTRECGLLENMAKHFSFICGDETSFSVRAIELLSENEKKELKLKFVADLELFGAGYVPLIKRGDERENICTEKGGTRGV